MSKNFVWDMNQYFDRQESIVQTEIDYRDAMKKASAAVPNGW